MKAKPKKSKEAQSRLAAIAELPDDFDVLLSNNMPFALFSYWVSNVQPEDVPRIAPLVPNENFFVEVRTLDLENMPIVNPRIFKTYNQNEGRFSAAIGFVRPAIQGRYLRILLGYNFTLTGNEPHDLLLRTVNRIRMIGGIGAAVEEVQRVSRDIVKNSFSIIDSVGIWGPLAQKDLQCIFSLDEKTQQEIRNLSTESWVHRSIQLALDARDNETRFIFLWTVLEGLLGDGRERSNYFLNELGSQELNNLAKNLFETRNRVFHEAKLEEGIARVVDLFELVRLAMLPPGNLRRSLVGMIESSIKK